MGEIITAFGIDWKLLVIQIFNFAILVAVLSYFLYRPVLKILSDRQKKIEQGVADAEQAAESRAQAETEKGKVLEAAHGEAKEVVARAEVHAKEKADTVIADASMRSERILESAAQRAEEVHAQAIEESEADIAKMAVLAAEKVMREKA